jgi:hypothetical protein
MFAIATIAKFLKKAYFVNSEFVVIAWHKIRPGLWFSIDKGS